MNEVKVFLFPDYVNLMSTMGQSKKLFQFLEEQGIGPKEEYQGGTLESLPTDGSVIIRASSRMSCSKKELLERCKKLGHFVFYNDCLLLPDETLTQNGLIEEATRFLKENNLIQKIAIG